MVSRRFVSIIQRSTIHLAAVSHTADGCFNNIRFASYLTGNRRIDMQNAFQRGSDPLIHELYGIRERRSLTPPKTKFVTLNV